MRVLTWNLEWASAGSERLTIILQLMASQNPEVACLTEVMLNSIQAGNVVLSESDYGYANSRDKHKVVLWSKSPWLEIDTFGSRELPSGRFATGITNGIRFVGVCIPWSNAHVQTGRKDRKAWQDHLAFLEGLRMLLSKYQKERVPICVLGDFNQRIPRVRQPHVVFEALMRTFSENFEIATKNTLDPDGNMLIDHFAADKQLVISLQGFLPKTATNGMKLTDHTGIVATVNVVAPLERQLAPQNAV